MNTTADPADKKIQILLKQVHWHVQANDADGVFNLIEKIHAINREEISKFPEPYKSILLDNLEFQRFALYHITNPVIKTSYEMAEELSGFLFRATVIEADRIAQANNFLQQYFYENLISGEILLDDDGGKHTDWRSLFKANMKERNCRKAR